jgi:hypothetical protein
MIGFHGLSIKVEKWDDTTQFEIIEDAAAEACAAKFKWNYQISNVYYANIGSLMLKMIAKWRITIDDIIQSQKTNDIYYIVGKIINSSPDNGDIETIMWIFNKVYFTDKDLTNEAINDIEQIRS